MMGIFCVHGLNAQMVCIVLYMTGTQALPIVQRSIDDYINIMGQYLNIYFIIKKIRTRFLIIHYSDVHTVNIGCTPDCEPHLRPDL